MDNDIPFLIKKIEQFDDTSKQKDTDDDLSVNLPRMENTKEEIINLEYN